MAHEARRPGPRDQAAAQPRPPPLRVPHHRRAHRAAGRPASAPTPSAGRTSSAPTTSPSSARRSPPAPKCTAAIERVVAPAHPAAAGRGLPRRARPPPARPTPRPIRRARTATGPPPTFRCSTRPPNCSARTTRRPAPPPRRNAQEQIAVRPGRAGALLRLPDLRVRGPGRRRVRGAGRARPHRRRAARRAARGGRPPQRRRARRGRPDLGVRAHHRRRGAGAVADGVAAADAPLPDPLDDPGRRPGADRGAGGRAARGRASSRRTSRTAGSTPGSASTTAPRPRSWTSRRQVPRADGPRPSSRRARSAPPAYGPGRARTDDLAGAVAEAVAGRPPTEGRLAVIAPRALHEALAAALPDAVRRRRPRT